MSAYLIRPYFSTFSRLPPPVTLDTTTGNYLLTGETDGFAINAISASQTPAYVGASYAGSVSVIDTGTPANNLSNVALDSSNLVQSGTSPKMVLWNSSPYVRWTPHNLVQYSQDFTQSAIWNSASTFTADQAIAPDGTLTADLHTTNGSNALAQDAASSTAGFPFTASLYAKYGSQQWICVQYRASVGGAGTDRARAWFDIQNGVAGSTATAGSGVVISSSMTSVGNGWYRCTVTGTSTDNTPAMGYFPANSDGSTTISTGSTLYLWGAQLVRGYNANPYLATTSAARIGIPQEYDTAASQYGILVEPAATNTMTYSEALTGYTFNRTSAGSTTTAPDGSSTAKKLVEDNTASATHGVYLPGSVSTVQYTISVFAKAGERTWAGLDFWDGSDYYAWFDLSNGTIGTVPGGSTATITAVGNGWYRLTHTRTFGGTTSNPAIYMGSADNTPTYNGNGSSGLYLWGFQQETGSVATSYIPTLSSTVTRAKDTIYCDTTNLPFSATAGTVILYAKPLLIDLTNDGHPLNISDDSVNERLALYEDTGPVLKFFMADGGATQADITAGSNGSLTQGTAYKAGAAWAANDIAYVKDNGTAGTDATATLPTMTKFRIGTSQNAAAALNHFIYQVTYLPRRATNTELQTKTT